MQADPCGHAGQEPRRHSHSHPLQATGARAREPLGCLGHGRLSGQFRVPLCALAPRLGPTVVLRPVMQVGAGKFAKKGRCREVALAHWRLSYGACLQRVIIMALKPKMSLRQYYISL